MKGINVCEIRKEVQTCWRNVQLGRYQITPLLNCFLQSCNYFAWLVSIFAPWTKAYDSHGSIAEKVVNRMCLIKQVGSWKYSLTRKLTPGVPYTRDPSEKTALSMLTKRSYIVCTGQGFPSTLTQYLNKYRYVNDIGLTYFRNKFQHKARRLKNYMPSVDSGDQGYHNTDRVETNSYKVFFCMHFHYRHIAQRLEIIGIVLIRPLINNNYLQFLIFESSK